MKENQKEETSTHVHSEKKGFFAKRREQLNRFIDKRPLASFFVFLGLIVGMIAIGNILRRPPEITEETTKEPTKVEVFSIGQAPKMKFSGVVEKSGAVRIIALSPGIVNYINVYEGSRVNAGQVLMGMASNYGGASIPSVSRQIAQQNYTLSEQNLPTQIELIQKRREVAEKSDAQADQLRDISSQSIQGTKDQISLNEQLLNSVNDQISFMEQNNATGSYTIQIDQLKQAKAGLLAALSGLRTGLRNTEYQTSNDEEPARLSDLGREITLKQLEIEERSLRLGTEIAKLNLRIAQISESLLFPVSPGAGVVERIYVTPGQSVNPGTVLAAISTDKNVTNVVVAVSPEIARQLSRIEPSVLFIGSQPVEITPRYISTEPTEGNLHSIVFTIPESVADNVSDGARIAIEMPVGQAKASSSVPYVPLDAVFQTQNEALVYVASRSAEGTFIAASRKVDLGTIFGSFVQVRSGISAEDQVILNRNILSGDRVTF